LLAQAKDARRDVVSLVVDFAGSNARTAQVSVILVPDRNAESIVRETLRAATGMFAIAVFVLFVVLERSQTVKLAEFAPRNVGSLELLFNSLF